VEAHDFLGFAHGLPAGAAADETLAATGHRLYRALLQRLRARGLSLLQPGRFLMPAPGPEPPWTAFFPMLGRGPLADLLTRRFDAYVDAVRRDLSSPLFGNLDRVVVLADLLSPLHSGKLAFGDAQAALAEAAAALRWQGDWWQMLAALARLELPPRSIRRVALAATKADHVADRQRGNLAALMRDLTRLPAAGTIASASFAIASVRCTEDFVWTLDGHPVSAVRGRRIGEATLTRSYPGEVPDRAPDDAFWAHRFLALPAFEPVRPPGGGRAGIPQINLDALLAFLLEDVL
jgi:predicted YcjX-like family ATPase